jgi:hypothetical protein
MMLEVPLGGRGDDDILPKTSRELLFLTGCGVSDTRSRGIFVRLGHWRLGHWGATRTLS